VIVLVRMVFMKLVEPYMVVQPVTINVKIVLHLTLIVVLVVIPIETLHLTVYVKPDSGMMVPLLVKLVLILVLPVQNPLQIVFHVKLRTIE
jgi:hypothetical protein